MSEEWRPVEGYEGHYSVSSMGRVKSFKQAKPRILKQDTDRDGYKSVVLCMNAKTKRRRVHHLVLRAFVGPRGMGLEARHINGKPGDNRACNLAWSTHKANIADKKRHGTQQAGVRHPGVKLHPQEVRWIRERRAAGVPRKEVAKWAGVAAYTVYEIETGRSRARA